MNAKKLLRTTLVVLCISLSIPSVSNAMSPESDITIPGKAGKVIDPIVRLKEIKDMDKSNLSKTEKKELKKEVKEMKKVIKASKKGVYLSIGAIVIIALVLILIL